MAFFPLKRISCIARADVMHTRYFQDMELPSNLGIQKKEKSNNKTEL